MRALKRDGHQTDMKRCRRFLISGRVQGVAYRATTQDAARALGISGNAKNLADGRVKVVACGDANSLKRFEQWLWQGPRFARVEKVVAEEMVGQDFDDFEV